MAAGRPRDSSVVSPEPVNPGPDRARGSAEPPVVELRGVTKLYDGGVHAVHEVSLQVEDGDFLTLLGPSGSGKSTVLRMIAGLLEPTQGKILLRGKDVTGVPPYRRSVAMVFQSLALFPHMSVFSNIAFPLRMRRVGRSEIARRVAGALELVHMSGMEERRARELSGGQQQRVALARAVVYDPSILLLDEPFAALDRRLRENMQLEVKRIHEELGTTIINVTHDQREALVMSSRIAVMEAGSVEQEGESLSVYARPATPFVASFMGEATLIAGALDSVRSRFSVGGGQLELQVSGPAASWSSSPGPADSGSVEATLVLAKEILSLTPGSSSPNSDGNVLRGHIEDVVFEGTGTTYGVATEALDRQLRVWVSRSHAALQQFDQGDEVCVSWKTEDATLVPGHG